MTSREGLEELSIVLSMLTRLRAAFHDTLNRADLVEAQACLEDMALRLREDIEAADIPHYTARQDWLAHGNACCAHCGQVPEQHHSDTRCYTADEIGARLMFYQRTRQWPGPDEGCTHDAP